MYIKWVIKSVRFKALLMYRTKGYMSKEVRLKVYKAHVLPVVDYCDVLYVNAKVDLLNQLQRIQNRCLKTCLDKHLLYSTEAIHAETNLPMLEERRKHHVRIYAYKRSRLEQFREIRMRETRLSTAPILKYSKPNCSSYEGCPEVLCAQTWNSLSVEVRNTITKEKFVEVSEKMMLATIPLLLRIV